MSKEYLLEVKNLSCERNYKLIFDNVSFKLCSGGVVLINGNNGSGKSSILMCISGILEYKGLIKINKKYNDKIGYVGHKNALCEEDTIYEYLTFWKKIYNYKKDFNYVINFFDLRKYLEIPIKFLSFGQKKKLSFLRLQMIKSQIWLLDEPISGLDKRTRSLIINLITKHIEKGGGVIATSHQIINLRKVTS